MPEDPTPQEPMVTVRSLFDEVSERRLTVQQKLDLMRTLVIETAGMRVTDALNGLADAVRRNAD